jgi:hypothetical protein
MMNIKTTKHQAKDLYLAEVGLTAAQIESAAGALRDTDLNLICSDQDCHISVNEFELIASSPAEVAT